MEKLILLIVAMFSAFASAQENCGYPVSLTRSGFEDGEQPAFIPLLPSNTPLTLAVDGLVANSTVSTEFIQAFGAFTGPANTGITVNGEAIATTNTRYASNLIRLRPGANTITIVASTMDGGSQTISRSINYNNALPLDIELLPEGANSFAPARVNFALRYQLPPQQTALVRAQIDYNGDGIFEVDAATLPTALGANYGEAGDFAVAIRLSFDDGDPQTPLVLRNATSRVLLETLARARQTLCFVYYEMKHRLQPGQSGITSALNTLAPSLRTEYQQIWTNLGSNLGSTANQLGEIVDGRISVTTAELTAALPDPAVPGEFFGFPVVLRRTADGVWRITEM